jgi:hypothetical protein
VRGWQGALPLFLLWIFLLIKVTPERFLYAVREKHILNFSGILWYMVNLFYVMALFLIGFMVKLFQMLMLIL